MTNNLCVAEQHREEREPAVGEVWFVLEDRPGTEFEGFMLDSSRSGFRASHSRATLATGCRVRFRHPLGKGHAMVMWNRILSRHVETGFLILDK